MFLKVQLHSIISPALSILQKNKRLVKFRLQLDALTSVHVYILTIKMQSLIPHWQVKLSGI